MAKNAISLYNLGSNCPISMEIRYRMEARKSLHEVNINPSFLFVGPKIYQKYDSNFALPNSFAILKHFHEIFVKKGKTIFK